MIEIFEFTDGKIRLSRAEIGMYKEFSAILRRDRGSEGDIDGRKKFKALRDFFYIYLVCDYRSALINRGFSGKELRLKAREEAQLPMVWREDDIIKAGMAKYKELKFDIKGELINELLLLFRGNYKRITNLRESIDKLLEKPGLTRSEMENISQLEARVFEIATRTPTIIKDLQRAMKDTEDIDMGDKKILRGGGEVPESADPTTAKS